MCPAHGCAARGAAHLLMVGERGFEPPAPASRRQCSTRLSYSPTDTRGPMRGRRGRASIGRGRSGVQAALRRDAADRVAASGRRALVTVIVFWSIGVTRMVAAPPGPLAVSWSPSRLQSPLPPSAAMKRPSAVNSKALAQSPLVGPAADQIGLVEPGAAGGAAVVRGVGGRRPRRWRRRRGRAAVGWGAHLLHGEARPRSAPAPRCPRSCPTQAGTETPPRLPQRFAGRAPESATSALTCLRYRWLPKVPVTKVRRDRDEEGDLAEPRARPRRSRRAATKAERHDREPQPHLAVGEPEEAGEAGRPVPADRRFSSRPSAASAPRYQSAFGPIAAASRSSSGSGRRGRRGRGRRRGGAGGVGAAGPAAARAARAGGSSGAAPLSVRSSRAEPVQVRLAGRRRRRRSSGGS